MISRKPELDISDLIYLHENNIGLRHQAEHAILQEAIKGGRGDALSLAAPLQNTVTSFERNLPRFKFGVNNQYLDDQGYYNIEKYGNLDNHSRSLLERNMFNPRNLLDQDDENQKWNGAQILKDFQDGIHKFIEVNSQFFSGKGDKQSAYMLLEMHTARHPRDIATYHGLGKCGTQVFTAEAIKSVIMREQEEKWDTDTIYIKVINKIKKLSKDYHLQHEAPILLSELESRGFILQNDSLPINDSASSPINYLEVWKTIFDEHPITLSGMIGGTLGLLLYDKLVIGGILGMATGFFLNKVSKSYEGRFFRPDVVAKEDPIAEFCKKNYRYI